MGPAKGVVTGSVIRASSHPVLAVPQTGTDIRPLQKMAKMLVTTDCSPQSKKVVDYAFELKQLFDCELLLLYAIELTSAVKFGIRQGYFTSKMRIWAKNQLENRCRPGRDGRSWIRSGTKAFRRNNHGQSSDYDIEKFIDGKDLNSRNLK